MNFQSQFEKKSNNTHFVLYKKKTTVNINKQYNNIEICCVFINIR